MAKGSARVREYTPVRNATITECFRKPQSNSQRGSSHEGNSSTIVSRKIIRAPSYHRKTIQSANKATESFLIHSEKKDTSDDQTLNSKYRLISLEKKFQHQSVKSKGNIETVSKKMEYLSNAN